MKKLVNLVVAPIAAVALLCVASVSPSHAATTSYASGGGNNANPCTRALPCRNISNALGVAGAGGTVSCLDAGPYTEDYSAGFSYTLDCPGTVYAASSFAISIVLDTVVTLRNAIFEGTPGGGVAVQISGGRVVFENCTFQNFTASPGMAVQFVPAFAGAHLVVTDSVFSNNGTGSGGGGIIIQPTGGNSATAVIERTQIAGNTYGVVANSAAGTVLVDIKYSAVAQSTLDGIWSFTGGGSVASIVVEHSSSVQNGGSGIRSDGANAFVSLDDATVDWNATGLSTSSGGSILSYQNNRIAGNLAPGVTPISIGHQ